MVNGKIGLNLCDTALLIIHCIYFLYIIFIYFLLHSYDTDLLDKNKICYY